MQKNSSIFIDIGQGLSLMAGLPRIASWDNSGRPKTAKAGTFGYNTETNRLEYYDGESWLAAEMSED